ncbi:AEC family transporter [Pseudomaricurvus alkylphenolicus]|uniref:AEC family transporter n=1 Tax=Pseudomaricurvus alkylphenolicus TaxID=1306991 RepID=UPI00141E56D1|nr:AEC family transporter [Pseudomaricurvus alkylphenolicus]NIB40522.1 AEC family transporter [Pseudomaricurvus alkylphenolicus]
MLNMLIIASITAPIFLLILIGFGAVRSGLLPQETIPGLNRFVLYLALPALIFTKLSELEIGKVLNVDFLLIYSGACALAFFTVFAISRWLLGDSTSFAGLKALGGAFPNSVFIGFPVLLQFFDSPPAQALVMVVMAENLVLFPLAFACLETAAGSKNSHWKGILLTVTQRLVKNPIIIAVFAGILASLAQLELVGFVAMSLKLLANAAAPVALLIIGGSLVGAAVSVPIRDIALVSSAKLLLHPLLVLLLILTLSPGMDPMLKQAAIIFAACPMMSMYPIIGSSYGHQSYCASVLLVTTLLAFVTVTLVLGMTSGF